MSSKLSIISNHLDLMNFETTIALIYGYFRANGFFDYNIKIDDFIKLVKKYMSKNQIKLVKSHKSIKLASDVEVHTLHAVSKECLVGFTSNNMLSL